MRGARNSDRRFCFEVVTPQHKPVYQSTSEEDIQCHQEYYRKRRLDQELRRYADSQRIGTCATEEYSISAEGPNPIQDLRPNGALCPYPTPLQETGFNGFFEQPCFICCSVCLWAVLWAAVGAFGVFRGCGERGRGQGPRRCGGKARAVAKNGGGGSGGGGGGGGDRSGDRNRNGNRDGDKG